MLCLLLSVSFLLNAESATMNKVPEASQERSDRIRKTFDEVRVDTLYLLDELYSDDMVFEDPLGRMEGLEEFRIYMEAMYQYVQEITWDYTDEVIQGDTHVLYWTMTLQTKGLNGGKPFSVDGTSHLKFNEEGNVYFHRDYFDMGAYVYERAPVVKWFVNFVKRRLHKAVEDARETVQNQKTEVGK
tara:strand:+ start:315 stop:872 length:558 start_codon:yes stop_codon:yes gene_type:complete